MQQEDFNSNFNPSPQSYTPTTDDSRMEREIGQSVIPFYTTSF